MGSEAGCPGNWDSLEPTGDRMIRFCVNCMRAVSRCESNDEAQARIAAGQLVAIQEGMD
jgi:hypothetical protein